MPSAHHGVDDAARGYCRAAKAINKPCAGKYKRKKRVGLLDKGGFIPNAIQSAIMLAARLHNPVLVAKSLKRQGMTVPGSKYIGPGNKMTLGRPNDDGDALAYLHDEAYQRLLDQGLPPEQVYLGVTDADTKAISSAKSILRDHADAGALAVYLGLSAKQKGSKEIAKIISKFPKRLQETLGVDFFTKIFPDPLEYDFKYDSKGNLIS